MGVEIYSSTQQPALGNGQAQIKDNAGLSRSEVVESAQVHHMSRRAILQVPNCTPGDHEDWLLPAASLP